MTIYTTMTSPLGELLLAGETSPDAPGGTALASVTVPGQKRGAVVGETWRRDDAAFRLIAEQLGAYFAGRLRTFDLAYAGAGTPFQQRVWERLDAIPYGATLTYGELATQIGAPRAAVRAVGAAVGANPLLVVRPCHRVLGKGGALTGYAGGLDRKRQLLEREGVALPDPQSARSAPLKAQGDPSVLLT